MSDKMQQAREIYLTQSKTQREIAAIVGVTERTIHNWMKQFSWEKLKQAAYFAPAMISQNLCSQLVELQQAVAKREPGNRFQTPQEAETMRKLITGIEKMKKYPSLSQNMQIIETFKNYVQAKDRKVSKELSRLASYFLEASAKDGFEPYQPEFGIDQVSPFSPSLDDDSESEENLNDPTADEHFSTGNSQPIAA